MTKALRAPAIPLVTIDPYTSCWLFGDQLHDDWPRHWTGVEHSMLGLVRVDGNTFRFMGHREVHERAATQTSCTITATRTVFLFDAGGVELEVVFASPLLMDDFDLLSRPVTYLDISARSKDGKAHSISVYFDMTGQWAVNQPHQKVNWAHASTESLDVLTFRHDEQPILEKAGDDLRIEWGTLMLGAPKGQGLSMIGDKDFCRYGFVRDGAPNDNHLLPMPRKTTYWGEPCLSMTFDLDCAAGAKESGQLLIGYDDEYSIEYFGEKLRPWWRRDERINGLDAMETAHSEHDEVLARCAAFDDDLCDEATAAGGTRYSELLALAYRQAIAACKLVAGPSGQPLFLSKENFSNACIGTVDVNYKSAPIFIRYSPALMRGMLDPIFDYCRSDKWSFPFPAHDLGVYPKANGQAYKNFHVPGTEDALAAQMPVEECGNMLLLTTSVCMREESVDYARDNWDLLQQWCDYLVDHGLDPEPQLVTDDFTGMMGHNVNLSAKAVMAIGAFALLARKMGATEVATKYRTIAENFARRWVEMSDDGDHSRLAFDQPGTWSQKYNLVWDKIFNLDLFDDEIIQRDIDYYRSKRMQYGTPLDSRSELTKPEWAIWVATMAPDNEAFAEMVHPIYDYVNETPNRVPVADIYFADSGRRRANQARSVVGGFYMKLLERKISSPDSW
ncbi:glutaminase domain-containing protein [Marivita sp.]|uniref:glutaminase family protein n=1 Tax=Marivita sp. TaxID=2003365 RepID=UPI003F715DB9